MTTTPVVKRSAPEESCEPSIDSDRSSSSSGETSDDDKYSAGLRKRIFVGAGIASLVSALVATVLARQPQQLITQPMDAMALTWFEDLYPNDTDGKERRLFDVTDMIHGVQGTLEHGIENAKDGIGSVAANVKDGIDGVTTHAQDGIDSVTTQFQIFGTKQSVLSSVRIQACIKGWFQSRCGLIEGFSWMEEVKKSPMLAGRDNFGSFGMGMALGAGDGIMAETVLYDAVSIPLTLGVVAPADAAMTAGEVAAVKGLQAAGEQVTKAAVEHETESKFASVAGAKAKSHALCPQGLASVERGAGDMCLYMV